MDKLMSLRSLINPVRVLVSQQRFAGHAKWQNIAHTKAANDRAKCMKISRHCKLITRACAGGTDPKINTILHNSINAALKAGVSRATIDRQVERAKNVVLKQEIVEVMGPGGAFLLFEIETDNISKTRQNIKKVLRKIPGYVLIICLTWVTYKTMFFPFPGPE
jgi:transcriptional/translational regulatory protein YebC/TACO1